MRSIVRGVVALFAAFLMMDVAKAAPTIVSPAENAEVKTISDKIWNDIHNDSIYLNQSTFYEGTHTSTYRKSAMADVNTNSVPIKLKWSGTSGECTVKIWRTRDLTANSSALPIFTTKVTGTTATYWDPEVGRDFTWSVTDSTGASVTGHFHTLQRTPRIIYADQNPDAAGAECSAGRDIGGWLTEDKTKRVRQGLVFRSAQIEYCSSGAEDHVYYPLTYLKDVLGIKLDLDLREDSHLGKHYAYPTNQVWSCSWKKNNSEYSEVYLKKAESNIGPGIPRYCVDTSYAAFPSYTGFTSNDSNKKSVWAAFKQIHDRVTKTTPEAVLFHCSHGKDRTGSLAYILLGALGVSEKDARRDFGFTWYLEAKSDVAMDTAGGDGYEGLTKLLNALPSGSTFKARCVAYLKACGTAAGDSDPEGKITAFQNAMLEAVEYQEDAYELPKEDSFTYNELYWRRKDGGGSFGSEYSGSVASKKGTLNYWYKTSTSTTANQVSTSWLDYNACYYFWPVSSLPWATPSCSYYKAGKIVSVCKSTSFTIGPYGLKAYFTDVDHTVSDRTIIEHREGLAHFDNFDIYFTKYDRTTTNSDGSLKYGGETGNKTLPSVYSGVGSLDIWANATFRASDMRDMSIYATHSSINKKPKLYLKFPSGNCNNARFEAVNGNDVNTYLGWFTGGDAGTKQYIKVEDSFLHFKSSDKVNGVAGILGLEFTLGSKNTTSSAAMMQIAGSLKINSGSTITVNAGGKGAGTYKLITTTGSLTDNANLTSYSTYKVTNCASGCYGTIIKNSTGKTVSVKIVKGTDPNEGTGGDVVEPETPTIEDIGTAQNGDWGYRVNIGNDVAIVFTNHNKTVNWTVPNTVKNVRYLVVAGGGGGGADFNTESNASPFQGGAGGGGGGGVEGTIPELVKNSVLTVTVGAGGNGGVTSIDNSDNGGIGAAASGSPSIVKLDTADYIIAYGGGGDGGTSDESSKTGNVGKSGGSSAGSRPGQTEVAEITPSYIHESIVATSTSYGNKGGAGYYVAAPDNDNSWWGYVAAAGGGGGATSVGADATSSSKPGNGGIGLTSDITGVSLVYGSGGGAGTISGADDIVAGKGGSGAGDGATGGNAGGNALANQGGGGGGGARKAAGGNGGSGIVVIRYSTVTGPVNPTEYGNADSAESTYTWIGYTGPWMYTTNWTATSAGTYGVPNNGTYATADFPATLENAFTCTLSQSVAVNKAEFNSPNMIFVLDNALLTLKGKVDSYAACDFGDGENDNSTIELRGANAGIVSDSKEVRLNFGYRHGDVTPTGTVTVRFVVPETGWESDARLKATGIDSKVVLYANSKLEIDATALGVPAEGTTKTVYLASGTGDDGVYVESKTTNIVCAAGAKGSIKIENMKLVLTVEADETTEPDEPQEPQLTAVDAPVAQAGLVYTGSELTGVESGTGYTLTGNTATDAGEYTAIATLAEGYKWSDDTTADKTITWSIAKATNEWTTEPKIEPAIWTEGSAGTYTAGVAKSGTEVVVTITKDGAASNASLDNLNSWTAGSYSITFTVDESKNYSSLSKEVAVTVNVSENEEPGDDPVSQIPTIPAEWGYVKTDLGDLHNEVAVVFTNHVDKAMSWTVPADIENVQFLVVGGGGGGGGAANATVAGSGGAGGGAGCVVTGIINKLDKDSVVTVNVGDGGKGGEYKASTTAGTGSADPGFDSSFGVDNVNYITAFGGAGDNGYNKAVSASGPGGSNPGARTKISSAVGVNAKAVWDSTLLATKMTNVVPLRNKGGHTNEDGSYNSYSSAGGGGATAVGHYPTTSNVGGWGGIGLLTDIAGDDIYYGSGGGGGSTKGLTTKSYYPDGVYRDDEVTNIWGSGRGASNGNGEDALPNQGGGGGGAGKAGNGGKGGSGIVVFRYTLKSEVKVDAKEYIESKLTDKVYTGSLLKSGLTEDEAYTVSEEGGVNVGEYTVQVTLKSGYVWADGNTSSTSNFTWKITKHENKWATEPLLSVTSWAQGYAPNVKFVAPVQTIGELNATITTNGVTEAFSGTLPTEPGDYTINYSVAETDNYNGRTWGASFKIYRSEPINGGYRVFGLGENGNEEAMVFTQSGSWNIDKSLENVQFLVVGGGGGGGADISTVNEYQAGSGGGGGGVVTGLVNFVSGQTIMITVGAGGQGAERGGSTSPYGAVKTQAENSSFVIGDTTSVVAFAGGGDTGSTSNSSDSTGGQTGGNGGSSAGSRATATGRGEATCGSVTDTAKAIVCSNTLGNKGGAGAAKYQAGGGGGATNDGEDGTENAGGNGGEGLASGIIGTDLVYGSGGGGGALTTDAGIGGSGAGNGGRTENATSAAPSQGGGGGGGGRVGNGGNGGSGIVVFRYVVNTTPTVGGIEVKVDANGVITNITTACDNFVVVGDISNYKFADYYTASVTDEGKLKIALNSEVATPVINETANGANDAIVVTDAKVMLGVTNAKVGLYYSVEAHSDPTCIGTPIYVTKPIPATGEIFSIEITKPNVDAAFFRVVVTDIPSIE